MLASREKLEDMDLRIVQLDAQAAALRERERTGDSAFGELADGFARRADELKEQIATGDYSRRDAVRRRMENWPNE